MKKNIKYAILTLAIITITIPTIYGIEFINGIQITSYDKNIDYMKEIQKCIEENTPSSIKVGKIYEEQRNLKIENESLNIEKTNIFDNNDMNVIQQNFQEQTNVSRGNIDRKGIIMEVPPIDTSFKSYMSYKTITNKNSLQWQYRQMAYTDNEGFRRINDDYVVALGTYYSSQCGDRFRITLSEGKIFTVITGDIKDNRHTDSTNRYIPENGNMIEFLVDTNLINKTSRKMGDMSYSGFEGYITSIEKL